MLDLRKSLSNMLGWRTKRKIVVIESDDWGSIRTRSKHDYDAMLKLGLELDRSNFTKYDALEANSDLENLFDLLSKHKDSTGRHPVITPMCVVANPDFEKIERNNFANYFFEPFTETCKKYPNHNRVHELWLSGISLRLFVPGFHGREHLNQRRWMEGLVHKDSPLRLAFNHNSFGVSYYKGQSLAEYLAAYDIRNNDEIISLRENLNSGGKLFKEICGYAPEHFIASNSPEPKVLEQTLMQIGVKYLTRYKLQKYPLGNNKFEFEINWIGKTNTLGQTIITRNCAFEPSYSATNDAVDYCLKDIEIAFKWGKPAVISSHRVNYVSTISPENAEFGREKLSILLKSILKKWPEVEFLTSMELGKLLSESRKK